MITNFKIFEEYSFPDSMVSLSNVINNFIQDKFQWWLDRKDYANFKDEYTLYTEDYDENIIKNEDFPVKIVNLYLRILKIKGESGVGGLSSEWRRKKDEYSIDSSYKYRKELSITLCIDVYYGNDKNKRFLKKEIEGTVRHELTHIYHYYKRFVGGYKKTDDYIFSCFLIKYMDLYLKNHCFTLYKLYDMWYRVGTTDEKISLASEFTIKGSNSIKHHTYFKTHSFENIYKKIIKQFTENFGSEGIDEYPSKFINDYKNYSGKPVPGWLLKFNTNNFKDFIKKIYDTVVMETDKLVKKRNKIIYQQKNNP